MALLTRTEAIWFLEEVLKIENIEQKLTHDKASLLNEIINHYQQKIPHQTITVISRPDEEQRLSTLHDIKTQMFSTQGGLCYDHTVFMKYLLEVLDFDVCFNACDIKMNGIHDHLSVLVKNLHKPGDQYYVDVGTADPIFQAIPLDFDEESPVYKCGFQFYKFIKENDEISWWQKVNMSYSSMQIIDKDIIVDGWRKYMTFTLEPKDIDYFKEPMIKHYVTQTLQSQVVQSST